MPRSPLKSFQPVLLLCLILHGAAVPVAEAAEKVLKVGGVGCALGTTKLLAAAFEKSHPGVKISVLPSLGTSGSIKAVNQGAIDIGIGGRPMKEDERRLGLHILEYARTPLVFVAGKGIRKTDLTTQELLNILKGDMQTWPDGQRVRMVLRPATDSESITLKIASPEIGKAVDSALNRKGMQIALNSQDCANSVENIPGAVGYSTLALVRSEKRPLKILSYNGVTPDLKSIAENSYPFSVLLYLVTKDPSSGPVKQFVDFVRSPEGKKILQQTGNLAIVK